MPARLRNRSDADLWVPVLNRVVGVDETVDVPDDVYTAHVWPESLWSEVAPARKPASSKE